MSITSTDKIYNVGESEIAYGGGFYPPKSGGMISVYVPRLMGAIKSTGKESIKINNLFANAPECKPAFNTSVTIVKTMPARVRENCNWLDKLAGNGKVKANSQFTIEFLNGNITEANITTK